VLCPYITKGKYFQSQSEAPFCKREHPTYIQGMGAQIHGARFVQWHIDFRVASKHFLDKCIPGLGRRLYYVCLAS